MTADLIAVFGLALIGYCVILLVVTWPLQALGFGIGWAFGLVLYYRRKRQRR